MDKAKLKLSGLDYLTVEVFQAQFGSSDFRNLRTIEAVRGVKHARVFGSTNSCPSYARWLEHALMSPENEDVPNFEDSEETSKNLGIDIWTLST